MTKELTRWPPYRGYSGPPSPKAYCAPKRCYCGQHESYEPLPPVPLPKEK